MESSQVWKVIVAGGLLALAVVLYVNLSSPDDDIPESPESATTWYCTACEKMFDVSAADADEVVRTAVATGSADGESGAPPAARGRGRQAFVRQAKCPTCEAWTGVETAQCHECQTVFATQSADGKPAVCPQCRWDPATGEIADDG